MKRILFVDDEINILDGVRRMLRGDRHRWDMQFAIGGEAALRACESGSFDIVISDMRMPGMDGATLLWHVRDRFPETVRCILSGHAEIELSVRAIPVAHRVLAKPFKGVELQAAIERICTLLDVLGTSALRQTMGTIGELPSLSATYLALTQAVNDPASSIARISAIIEQDVAMSAKVLQLVNSGFFGLAQRVSNIDCAVQFLGMETIKSLALTSETFRVFAPGANITKDIYERIQRHAQRTAAIARTLPVVAEDYDLVLAAALLHDIGRLVIASKLPDQFSAIRESARLNVCEEFEMEEAMLGISHAEIGAYLLGLWGIDSLVVEAIAHHHRPTRISRSGLDCSSAVYVADLLAHESERRQNGELVGELGEPDVSYLQELGLLHLFPGFRERAMQALA